MRGNRLVIIFLAAVIAGLFPVRAVPGQDERRIEFRGTIESLPDRGLIGLWIVSARRVHVTESTEINQEQGPPRIGAFVEVHGFVRGDRAIVATRIEVKSRPDDGRRVEFRGIIESLPDQGLIGVWVVSSHRVHVTEETRINQEHGRARVGAFVEVHGFLRDDQAIVAIQIEVKASPDDGDRGRHIEFRGTVERMPAGSLIGDWLVEGRVVHVSDTTRIDQEHGQAMVGSLVEVKGWAQGDGSINAAEIEVKVSPDRGRRISFRGPVERLPETGLIGDWVVGGRVVHVTPETAIRPRRPPELGAIAQVKGIEHADGSVTAESIKIAKR
jgi:hypothetical protein